MTEPTTTFQPDWISPPGDTIFDLLEEKGWSQAELAQRTGYSKKHINQLINGNATIAEETAIILERVLGSNARFWLNREVQYREALAREEEFKSLEQHTGWLKELPLSDIVKFGWVEKQSQKARQVAACLKFFGVATVDAWRQQYTKPLAAFKASNKFSKNGAAVSAWLRQGERTADHIECSPYNKPAFKQVLQTVRSLTNEADPERFVPQLTELCASVGIAVVFEQTPKGCPVTAATKWLSPEKALIMLSLRHKTNDHLWFAFFHEAAHILLHGKKMTFLEMKGLNDQQEEEADRFAKDWLIPPKQAKALKFIRHTYAEVEAFAEHLGIAPAIVVGRMQNEGLLPWKLLNKVKVRYQWVEN